MELGDASNEEAPLPCSRKREMLKNSCLQMIFILQSMQGDGSPQRGLITIITKRFDMACSTVYRLWEWAACMHATGDIISPEINSWKKFQEASCISKRVHPGGVSRMSCCGRGIPKENLQCQWGCQRQLCIERIVVSTICVHCNSLKPVLTEENKVAWLLMVLHFRDPLDLMKYHDMHDQIHLDEKWFFLTWEKERYLLLLEEKNPK